MRGGNGNSNSNASDMNGRNMNSMSTGGTITDDDYNANSEAISRGRFNPSYGNSDAMNSVNYGSSGMDSRLIY